MSSILVVEPDHRSSERIHAALAVDGWRIRVVGAPVEAQRIATAERPDLFLVSASVPGADTIAGALARGFSIPGVVLAVPFTDEELREVVRRSVPPPPEAPRAGVMLTSWDIFGDVLAEVEADSPAAAPSPTPAAPAILAIPAIPAAPPRPAAPPPMADPPRPASPFDDGAMNRKLEQTLSGVMSLGADPKRPAPSPAAPPPAAPPAVPMNPLRRADVPESEIDALLSKTLSTLELGARPRRPAPPPAAPPPAVPPAVVPPPASPASTVRIPIPVRPPAPAPPSPPPAVPEPFPEPELIASLEPDLSEVFAEPELEAVPELLDVPELPPLPPPAAAPPAARDLGGLVNVADMAEIAATQRIQIPPMSVLSSLSGESDSQPGESFGQYTLLEKIAAGGMAEVWKARMRGVEGFQKTVAIKKILGHLNDDSEFVGMFIDEAKLAAQLSHPNIVHIYDFGKISRDYYIAMEYVEGKDLRSLMNAGRRRGVRLSLPLAMFIGARLASALDYAHRKRDFEGRDLSLVHRDVSPQNVLLSLEGDVKLCDFGIAKAVSKAGHTQMGALKGKLQYMSPEQAWGRPVDSRSDIFSLGAVLFEMLTGERLFTGETEMSVLEAVRQGQIRSTRQIVPSIPPEVDEIVARALAYEPQSRFASAGEMKQRIEAVLHTLGQTPDPTDLAAYIQRASKEEPPSGDWSQATPQIPEAPQDVPEAELFAVPAWSRETPEPMPPPVPAEVDFPASEPFAPFEVEPVAAVAPLGDVQVEEPARGSRRFLYILIAILLVVAILTFYYLFRRPGAAPRPVPASPVSQPATSPASLPQNEIDRMVKEEMARREASIRKTKEAEIEQYQKEIQRMQEEARKKKKAADAAANQGEPPRR
jgi:serine/threonine protein kinase/CheY-like chemotaxis protein